MEYGGTQAAGPIFDPRTDTPSFLYAMPLADKRVLLEETCLGAMTPLTFGELKGRLERRMAAMGIRVTRLLEEEWLTIPMGGPLPLGRQPLMAFGATARLLHPSTGYSVARSLQAAPPLARQIAGALAAGVASEQATHQAWQVLWPADARRQAAFQVYGMQLIAGLKMRDMVAFFAGFYTLPTEYWHGYVSHTVSGAQLLLFAFMMSWKLPLITQASMLRHVLTDASTLYLLQTYLTAAVASNIAQPSAPAAAAPGGAAGRS